jgi:hypothetical protein
MFKVYYTVNNEWNSNVPMAKTFGPDQMSEAMSFMENLRISAIEKGFSFISICSENPDRIGKDGAADVLPGYDWKKRRD